MAYEDGDEWLDGPRFAAWLGEHGFVGEHFPNFARRVVDWRKGARACLRTVEPVLIALGYHPIELPDECWSADQGAKPAPADACRNGHPRTPENTQYRDGRRTCLVCRRAAWHRWHQRHPRATGARAKREALARVRQDHALLLRTKGKTWAQIAQETGLSGPGAAYHAANAARRRKEPVPA